jgi:uncharacterized DUF497 family protein
MVQAVELIYDKDKSRFLRETRGLGFEEIIEYIEEGCVVDIVPNPNMQKYKRQWMYQVNVDGYIFVVPYVISETNQRILKTIYPSRKATRKYLGGLS